MVCNAMACGNDGNLCCCLGVKSGDEVDIELTSMLLTL
jgi:hypothetical protein